MKHLVYLVFLLLVVNTVSYAQSDTLESRIVLIGDAGSFHNGRHPVIDAVKLTTKIDKQTTILFLGDNLYLTGLPDQQTKGYDVARAVLDTQVSIANGTDAKVYFIPGNHDWNRGHPGGLDAIRREGAYITSLGGSNVKFYPEDGCGGPVEVPVSKNVTMILFDSQWWIYPYDKPEIESDCPYKTKTEILSQMEDILTRNSNKLVIIACHHPFKSYGIHGGYFTIKQHIFPFTEMFPKFYFPMPGIGSIYPIARGVFGTPQDIAHPAYTNMIKDVERVAKGHPNVIFVAGHEHNLQYIKDSSYNYIISGAGTKSTRVSKNKKAPFTSQSNGFALLEISKNKNVDLSFYTVKDSISRPFKDHVLNFSTLETVADSTKVEAVVQANPFKDSVTVAANMLYDTASGFHRFILGNNYRKEWATAVNLKVFNISKEKGGFKIASLGGGKQTKSLKLIDKDGREWVLRTINKDPEKAIPENLRGSLAQRIVQDMISASDPYGPLTVPPLAKAIGVNAPSPEFFYVPDDPTFGIYRPIFSNTVCMLEEREPNSKPGDTKSSAKVINKLIEDNDNHVDQQSVLNARLLDLLLADWDRHLDQWRFSTEDTGKGKLYYAIPRDRDQVYFNSDGLLIQRLSINIMPYLTGFKKDVRRINWLAWEARDFDRLFMNGLSEDEWKKALDNFKNKLSDAVIVSAVKKLPKEIFALRGESIISKLKSRRDELAATEGLKYYRFLSKTVNVVGSNKKEHFIVTKADGGVQVKVYKRTSKNDTVSIMYDRVLKDNETKEVRLYGLNNDDIFDVDSTVRSKIILRIIGGRGNDTFNIKGKMQSYLYDLNTEQNYVNSKDAKKRLSYDASINRFDFTGFQYNTHRFPKLNIAYNSEDLLMVGAGFVRKTYAFRKEPYSSQQRLSALYAMNRGAYQLKYNGEFNKLKGRSVDMLVNAEMAHSVLNNFYGLGNLTTKTKDNDYYRVRYNYLSGEVLFRRRMGNVLQLLAGPQFYNYSNSPQDNVGKILSDPQRVDSARVYATKNYGGGKVSFIINNVNSELLPTRGIYWNTSFTSMYGLNKQSNNISTFTSDLSLYSSLTEPTRVVAVMKAGIGKIYSDNYEYFQALSLGANNYLRGFRKNRFSGSSLAYGSFELRVKLFESKSYLLPGAVGVLGFEEAGKVWVKDEVNKKWHNSFGGGLYFSPYNLLLLSATAGFSDEDRLLNFSIGTKFNITF